MLGKEEVAESSGHIPPNPARLSVPQGSAHAIRVATRVTDERPQELRDNPYRKISDTKRTAADFAEVLGSGARPRQSDGSSGW